MRSPGPPLGGIFLGAPGVGKWIHSTVLPLPSGGAYRTTLQVGTRLLLHIGGDLSADAFGRIAADPSVRVE
ncbi:hypothetical protein GN244_ATG11763 [Phytophthora infestans]|uniref:Uncharacterized protein n=1 Tax=Phytophthora infestans TaxID=4787 RepID=A0A833SQW0_PHYIN|nr:hypothetical protein GN244_ATG11763 [Phytophthora infestans]